MKPAEFILLNSVQHSKIKIKPVKGYFFTKENHFISLVLHEFPKASANYPIVFVRHEVTEKFIPVALLGLEPGNNLFVSENGQWLHGAYIPAAFRRYPFALAQTDPDMFSVCVDIRSEYLNQEEGVELFDIEGQPTQTLEKIKDFLLETYRSELAAEVFCNKLVELNLLIPAGFKVQGSNGVMHYDGSFVVDEQKLASLNSQDFLTLRDQGFLAAIYAHLVSLMQIDKLGFLRTAID